MQRLRRVHFVVLSCPRSVDMCAIFGQKEKAKRRRQKERADGGQQQAELRIQHLGCMLIAPRFASEGTPHPLPPTNPLPHAHTRTHAHTRAHTRTHAHASQISIARLCGMPPAPNSQRIPASRQGSPSAAVPPARRQPLRMGPQRYIHAHQAVWMRAAMGLPRGRMGIWRPARAQSSNWEPHTPPEARRNPTVTSVQCQLRRDVSAGSQPEV